MAFSPDGNPPNNMNSSPNQKSIAMIVLLLTVVFVSVEPRVLAVNGGKTINTAELRSEVNDFGEGTGSALAVITSLDPPPSRS
jgi:hypothetical protein